MSSYLLYVECISYLQWIFCRLHPRGVNVLVEDS